MYYRNIDPSFCLLSNLIILFHKRQRIQYAKSKSDAVSKLEGTYIQREKKPREKRKTPEQAKPAKRQAASQSAPAAVAQPVIAPVAQNVIPAAVQPAVVVPELPNSILFLTNLPNETTELMLSMLFNQFPGFKEVRLVPGRSDIAFVEFENEVQSGTAKEALQGFRITPSHAMKISYAKK